MADFGTLSSLGIGSGVLTYDVIDKLKKADEDIMLKPIEDKLDIVQKQEKSLSEFIDMFNTIKDEIFEIGSGTSIRELKTNINGNSVSIETIPGVLPQTFDINVLQLAKNDIYESNGFSSLDEVIASKDTQITIGLGDTTTTLNINAGTTLNELKDIINNANIDITAQILDTGIDDNPYKLILKANETGKDNIIKFDYGTLEDLGFNQTIYQSAVFNSDTDIINNSGNTQTFSITINGRTYSIDVLNNETVSDFINDINSGKLVDENGNSLNGITANYNTDTGRIEFHLQQIGNINIDDTNLLTNFNDNTNFSNTNRLQIADNSKFEYNGVEIERNSNKITDLIPGITINLNTTGLSNIDIQYDKDNIINKLQQFVTDYNKFISNLHSLTTFNQEEGTVGLFNNNTDIKNIEKELYNAIFNNPEAVELGLEYNKDGFLNLNTDTFIKNFENNPNDFLNKIEKVFNNINAISEQISNTLDIENNFLNNKEKKLEKQQESIQKLLEERYKAMAQRFADYDELINKFNIQSSIIQNLIEQELANK